MMLDSSAEEVIEEFVTKHLELLKLENDEEVKQTQDETALKDLVVRRHEYIKRKCNIEFASGNSQNECNFGAFGARKPVVCKFIAPAVVYDLHAIVYKWSTESITLIFDADEIKKLMLVWSLYTCEITSHPSVVTHERMTAALANIINLKDKDLTHILLNSNDSWVKYMMMSEHQNLKSTSYVQTVKQWSEKRWSDWFKAKVIIFWQKYIIFNRDFKPLNNNLSMDQITAFNFAIYRKNLAIIQGPPGTGKTTSLVELILQLSALDKQILVCAPTNVAVDNLLAKVAENGKKPLRIGDPTRIAANVMKYSLSEIVDAKVNKLKGKTDYQKRTIRNDFKIALLKEYKIIFSTLSSAATGQGDFKYVPRNKFDVVIVDEAAQAVEASTWIAIPHAEKLILAGDIHQLPPVIKSREAKDKGLGISLMERLMDLYGEDCYITLTQQYRMNSKIMNWSSSQFYEDKLVAHPSVANHLLTDLLAITKTQLTCESLALIDTARQGCSEYAPEKSRANLFEAIIADNVVAQLILAGVKETDIGIITPYKLQSTMINALLTKRKLTDIDVSTVDGFQGSEKEVIIVSMVRSNLYCETGFVKDPRRLNVAITRAKRLLVVIVDSKTMRKCAMIKGLINYIKENGVTLPVKTYLQDDDKEKMNFLKSFKPVDDNPEVAPKTSNKGKPKVEREKIQEEAKTIPSGRRRRMPKEKQRATPFSPVQDIQPSAPSFSRVASAENLYDVEPSAPPLEDLDDIILGNLCQGLYSDYLKTVSPDGEDDEIWKAEMPQENKNQNDNCCCIIQ